MGVLKKIILFCGVYFFTLTAYSQWTELNSGTTVDLNAIIFEDSLMGYCVGENGTILKTKNAGIIWTELFKYSGLSLKTILCKNKDTVIAAGYRYVNGSQAASFLLSSYDAGTNWTIDSSSFKNIYITKMYWSKDSNNFYMLGVNKNTLIPDLYKYANGKLIHLLDSVLQFDFIEGSDTGIILNVNYHSLLKSTDAGANWDSTGSLATFKLSNNRDPLFMSFINSNLGLISYHYPSNILITENGGRSWNNLFAISALDIFHVSDSVIYTAGQDGISKISRIKNSWSKIEFSDSANQHLSNIFFIDENNGYAIGKFGTILKTTNGGGSGVGLKENNSLKKKIKVFPNPAKGVIHIETEGHIDFTSLTLMDNQGKEVREYNKDERELKLNDLPSGIYILKLQTDKGEITEKIVVQ